MNIDKDHIVGLLRDQGNHDQADQAAQRLPDQVETENSEHVDMLSKFGLNVDSVPGKLGGLGGLLK